ncbi:hypothetical protein EON64_13840, partial [archaeon]
MMPRLNGHFGEFARSNDRLVVRFSEVLFNLLSYSLHTYTYFHIPMAPSKSTDPLDLVKGGVLQCMEAGSVGLPFEVWKTHMGTYRNEKTMEAFRNIYKKGGMTAFWSGWQPKMVESFLKGGILLFTKEALIRATMTAGLDEVSAGLLGGFGGGVAQVTVMGPCTFLVTAAVMGDKSVSLW